MATFAIWFIIIISSNFSAPADLKRMFFKPPVVGVSVTESEGTAEAPVPTTESSALNHP